MTSAELSSSSVTWNLTTIFSLCFRTDALTVKSRGQRLYFRNSKRTWNILLNEMGCPSERVDKRGWKSLNLSTSEQGSACHLKDFELKRERSSVPVCRVLSCCIFSQTVPPDLLVFNAGSQMQCQYCRTGHTWILPLYTWILPLILPYLPSEVLVMLLFSW